MNFACRSLLFLFLVHMLPVCAQEDSSRVALYPQKDTMPVTYRYLGDLTKEYTYSDTSLGDYFHVVDKAISRDYEYEHLGNNGSSVRPMVYASRPVVGYNRGYRQYDLYNYTPDVYKVYKAGRSFTHASFSPRGGTEEFVIDAQFYQRFKEGIGLSVSYDRTYQEGIYQSQSTKVSNFGTSLYREGKRYNVMLSILSNVVDEKHNGGVSSDVDLKLASSQNRQYLGVVLSDAASRYQEKTVDLRQSYVLSNHLEAYHKAQYQWMYYKYGDNNTNRSLDSIVYGKYLTDARGLRMYYRDRSIANTAGLGMKYDNIDAKLGLRYAYIYVNNEYHKQHYHDLQTVGDITYRLSNSIAFAATARAGMLDAAGTYRFTAMGDYSSSLLGIRAMVEHYRMQPSFSDTKNAVSGQEVFDLSLANPTGTIYDVQASVSRIGISIGYRREAMHNAIYHDAKAIPIQLGTIYTVDRLTGTWRWQWRGIRMHSHVYWQRFSTNIYQLPTLYAKSDLSYERHVFKKAMLCRLGVTATYVPSRAMSRYMPVTGSFYQSPITSDNRQKLDVYLSARVQTFRAFLSVDNVLSYIDRAPIIQVYRHPMPDAYIRFGISWLFRN